MPTKQEIKANKAEAKRLGKLITAAQREHTKLVRGYRKQIGKIQRQIDAAERTNTALVQKINRRLAILDGRNSA
jgi:hypothetical protein